MAEARSATDIQMGRYETLDNAEEIFRKYSPTSVERASKYATLIGGLLAPGEAELCPSSWPCTVAFLIEGTVVVSAEFSEDPGLVALVERNGHYALEITPDSDEGSVAS